MTENALPAENAVSAVAQMWGWKSVIIKTDSLRRKEMLNGKWRDQVKGFELQFEFESKWSNQCKLSHHLKFLKWLETNKIQE